MNSDSFRRSGPPVLMSIPHRPCAVGKAVSPDKAGDLAECTHASTLLTRHYA